MNNKRMRQCMVWALILLIAVLIACAKKKESYTVRFWCGEEILDTQNVRAGDVPQEVDPEMRENLIFAGWDRLVQPVDSDTDYSAVYIPELNQHVPYLFAWEDELLHPDDPFTFDQLGAALQALSSQSVRSLLPELPKGKEGITAEEMLRVMQNFCGDAEEVFAGIPDGQMLTRREAASVINYLLGRSGERISPDKEAIGFADVPPEKNNADLLEASVAHEQGNLTWWNCGLKTCHECGWEIKNGQLRYFDECGYIVKNTEIANGLIMSAEGIYTSGNAELDGYVTEVLASIQREMPDADRQILLRMAYEYSRDNFAYLRKKSYDPDAADWEIPDAIEMFATGKGNCYNYAAVFWALARGLGYDAVAVNGAITGVNGGLYPHSWVKIDFEDETYYFDPEQEMTVMGDSRNHRDLFMVRKETAQGWMNYHE